MSAPVIDESIQTDFPNPDRTPIDVNESWDMPEWLADIFSLLADFFWIGLIVAAIVILVLIVREMRAPAPRRTKKAAKPIGAATIAREQADPVADPDMAAIDALAHSGRFAEALHTLLSMCDLILHRRARARVLPSSTSRELARNAQLPQSGLSAYRDIVGAVESTRFGGRAADLPLYQSAREAFGRFTESVRSAAA